MRKHRHFCVGLGQLLHLGPQHSYLSVVTCGSWDFPGVSNLTCKEGVWRVSQVLARAEGTGVIPGRKNVAQISLLTERKKAMPVL